MAFDHNEIPRDFKWILRARSTVQQQLLDLHTFGKERRAVIAGAPDSSQRRTYLTLVGAAYSLWRAAFLTAFHQSWESVINDANELLEKILTDNTVSFATDLKLRGWMMGYYLNNALYRLTEARGFLGDLASDTPALKKLEQLYATGLVDITETPNESWDVLSEALSDLSEVMRAQPPNGQSSSRQD